jgi:hypothetical protein
MAKESDKDGLLKDFLRVNIKTLKLVGLWNSFGLERKTRPAYTTYSCFVATVIFLHVASQVVHLFYVWGDLDKFSATTSTLLTYGAALIKQLCYLVNSNQIYRLVYRLRDGKLSPPSKWSEEQKNIAKSYDRHARIMSWSYYSLGIGCLFCFAMTAIVSINIPTYAETNSTAPSPRKLPYGATFPFDIEQTGYYGIVFSFQMLVILLGPTVNFGLDTMFVGLVIHACGQFKILKNGLRNIKQRATIVVGNEQIKNGDSATDKHNRKTSHDNQEQHNRLLENLQQKMSIGLNECLQHHQEILK